MFGTIRLTRPVEIGPGVTAHVDADPTVGAYHAIESMTDRGLSHVESGRTLVAVCVSHWTGPDVPTGDTWPPLSQPGALDTRCESITQLPGEALKSIVAVINDTMAVSEEDVKKYDGPSE